MIEIVQFAALVLTSLSMGVHFGTWLTEAPLRETIIGDMAVTLAGNVPINKQVQSWEVAAPPAGVGGASRSLGEAAHDANRTHRVRVRPARFQRRLLQGSVRTQRCITPST